MSYKVAFKSAHLLKMSLVTIAAMLATCLLALVAPPNTAATSLAKNGKIAFTSDDDGIIYTVEPSGSNLAQLTNSAYVATQPIWSPDGTELAFIRQDAEVVHISVMSADGSNLNNLLDLHTSVYPNSGPTWSPDGTKIAFESDDDIYTMDSDGSNQTNLTKTPKLSEQYPAYSPNGSQMCFFQNPSYSRQPPGGIYVMDSDGSEPTLLFETYLGGECDWSPDGTKIAFSAIDPEAEKREFRRHQRAVEKAQDEGDFQKSLEKAKKELTEADQEVYVINVDGSGLTNLSSNLALDVQPDWSPDGTKITFASDREGVDMDIYTMDADGSDVAQVTNSPSNEDAPDWQPLPGSTEAKEADGSDEAQGTKKPGVDDVDGARPERTVIVKPGDSLWSISEQRLGPEATPQRVYDHTYQMYALNRERIGADPDLIFAGQRLSLPPLGEG